MLFPYRYGIQINFLNFLCIRMFCVYHKPKSEPFALMRTKVISNFLSTKNINKIYKSRSIFLFFFFPSRNTFRISTWHAHKRERHQLLRVLKILLPDIQIQIIIRILQVKQTNTILQDPFLSRRAPKSIII